MDLKSFAAIVMKHVREYVQPAIDELSERINSIPAGKDGRDGIDGKNGETGVAGDRGEKGDKGDVGPPGPAGERGEKGEAGKDGRDGADGKDGIPGRDGANGKSITIDDVRPVIDDFLKSIPLPQNGRDGERGLDGKSVTVEDVLPHFQQAFDKWALDFERRAQDIHTRLLSTFDKPKDGRDGVDGKDGADGLGFDDVEEEFDGERTVIRRYRRGDQVKEFRHKFHSLLERGVWKIDRSYERGDGVTFDGSYWIAQRDTKDKPGTSDAWRLAVKKGRDGKGS
jgi:hypothetical protein